MDPTPTAVAVSVTVQAVSSTVHEWGLVIFGAALTAGLTALAAWLNATAAKTQDERRYKSERQLRRDDALRAFREKQLPPLLDTVERRTNLYFELRQVAFRVDRDRFEETVGRLHAVRWFGDFSKSTSAAFYQAYKEANAADEECDSAVSQLLSSWTEPDDFPFARTQLNTSVNDLAAAVDRLHVAAERYVFGD